MFIRRFASPVLAILFFLHACSDDKAPDPKPQPQSETGTLRVEASAPGDAQKITILLEAERSCEEASPCWDEATSFALALDSRDDDISKWSATQSGLAPGNYRLLAEWESGSLGAQRSPSEELSIEAKQTRLIELVLEEEDGTGGTGGEDGHDDPGFVTVTASQQSPEPGAVVEIVVKATDGQKGRASSFTLSGQSGTPIPLGDTECPAGCTAGTFGAAVDFAAPKAGEELRSATLEWTAPSDIGQFQHTLLLRIQTDEKTFAERELKLTVSPEGGCPQGYEDCNGVCKDLNSDREFCGTCDNDCTGLPGVDVGAVTCNQGTCDFECALGFGDCDDTVAGCETSTFDNDEHCGACDSACTGDLYCLGTHCLCPTGQQACPLGGDACTNVSTDVQNCGQCGFDCLAQDGVATATCGAGQCQFECAEGRLNCDGDPANGCETDLMTDHQRCGTCDNACSALEVCEEGVCVGTCAAEDRCDGVCKDLQTDLEHCGACDSPCDGACKDGVCENTVVAISSMYLHTCALLSDTTVRCWGNNATFPLGVDDTTAGLLPVQVKDPLDPSGFLNGVVQITTGGDGTGSTAAGDHSCALLKDGTAKCWGSNKHGQLGDGLKTDRWQPMPVLDETGSAPLEDIEAIAVGAGHTCALDSHGVTRCWGKNTTGQIGLLSKTPSDVVLPVPVRDPDNSPNALPDVVKLSPGKNYTCLLMKDTTARCWGNGGNHQNGNGSSSNDPKPVPHAGPVLTDIVHVDAESTHTCALLKDKTVRCWGAGQKVNGGSGNSSIPVEIMDGTSPLSDAVSLELGDGHTCVILEDGTARCWGGNSNGSLGTGVPSGRIDVPTVVVADDNKTPFEGIVQIAAGSAHTCFLNKDGEVYCAGSRLRVGSAPTGNDHPIPLKVTF